MVILLHAFPMDSLLWSAQRRALSAAGYRVVTPDLPGFGGSARIGGPESLDRYADELAHLMDHLTVDRAVVGGLSMGGYVTMAMLRRHPQRVSGIILADTKAAADAPEAARNRLAMAEQVVAAGGQQDVVDGMLVNLLGATSHAQRPELVATVRRWILAQDPLAVAWAQRAMAARPDSLATLAGFAGPALVLRGSEDTLSTIPDVAAMTEALRRGGSEVSEQDIGQVGHLSAVEDPAAVSAALAGWLEELPAAG